MEETIVLTGTLTDEEFDAWLEALESDRFKRCTGQLREEETVVDVKEDGGEVHGVGHCCLGVLSEAVFGIDLTRTVTMVDDLGFDVPTPLGAFGGILSNESGVRPDHLLPELYNKLDHATREKLADLNDSEGATFEDIARILRAHRETLVAA